MERPQMRHAAVVAALTMAALACGTSGSEQATVEALAVSISGTATAAAAGGDAVGDALLTAEAKATESIAAIQATAEALLNLSESDRAATEEAAAPLLAELPTYGVDPSQGRLAWVHPPVTVQVSGYLQSDFANQYFGTVARDFVLSTDITWNTTTGVAGCGFAFRSDGNQDALSQYVAVASRGGNGRVIFQSMVEGETKNAIDIYAYGRDPAFQWRNDTTNRLTLVVRGDQFKVFTNGTEVGLITAGDPPSPPAAPPPPTEPPEGASQDQVDAYQDALEEHDEVIQQMRSAYAAQSAAYSEDVPYFDRGFVAMIAVSESGTTICRFDNTWLWLFNDAAEPGGS